MIVRLLRKKPYIIYLPISELLKDDIKHIAYFLKDRTVYFILFSNGYMFSDTISDYNRLLKNKQYSNHYFICLANSIEEYWRFNHFNIDVEFINHNAFIDPRLFFIMDIEKEYKAIYNARFHKVKRHFLARNIDNLACICWSFFNDEEKDNYKKICKSQNIKLLNKINDGCIVRKTPQEINIDYNRSYVGLCLSSTEGAMYSSIEYLLAGLPVVSTKSRGGRDIFFNDYNSIIVDDDANAVRDAVYLIVNRYSSIDRHKIRNNAIEQQNIFINRFKNLISNICVDNGIFLDINLWWSLAFSNKLTFSYDNIDEFLSKL